MKFQYSKAASRTLLPTWVVVSTIILFTQTSSPYWGCILLGQAIFLLCALILINEQPYPHDIHVRRVSIIIITATLVTLFYLSPVDIMLIYSVIFVAILPYFIRTTYAVLLITTLLGTFLLIQHLQWNNSHAYTSAALWSVFHLFALALTQSLINAENAKQEAINSQKALEATQSLIKQTSEQNERLRLARELHDAIGHQLTGLTIKLDVARRSEHPAHSEKIEELYSVSKTLLHDIRHVVSDNRVQAGFNIIQALTSLTHSLPRLNCNLQIDSSIQINNPNTAITLLRITQEAISNTLKHTQANQIHIHLKPMAAQHVKLVIHDNAVLNRTLTWGNGLKGMKERVQLLQGTLIIQQTLGTPLCLTVTLPTT